MNIANRRFAMHKQITQMCHFEDIRVIFRYESMVRISRNVGNDLPAIFLARLRPTAAISRSFALYFSVGKCSVPGSFVKACLVFDLLLQRMVQYGRHYYR